MHPLMKRRLELGLRRKVLANMIECTWQSIRNWEEVEKRSPSEEYYPKLAKALKLKTDDVIAMFNRPGVRAK